MKKYIFILLTFGSFKTVFAQGSVSKTDKVTINRAQYRILFPDDWNINQKAERQAATVNPDIIFGRYDRTSDINKPVVLIHTIYDQLIPPIYGVVNFENMVHQKNKDQYFTVKYTNGQGHCNFTPQQTGEAFDALRNWAKTGQKAKAGIIQ